MTPVSMLVAMLVVALRETPRNQSEENAIGKTLIRIIIQTQISKTPYANIPEHLLQALREISQITNIIMPLADNIGLILFKFNEEAVDAVKEASFILVHTPYAYYFGLQDIYYNIVRGKEYNAEQLFLDCYRLANVKPTIIVPTIHQISAVNECLMRLTADNLPSIFIASEIDNELIWDKMVFETWSWILNRLLSCPTRIYDKIMCFKEISCAWRNMILYTSMINSDQDVLSTLTWELAQMGLNRQHHSIIYNMFIQPLIMAFHDKSPNETIFGFQEKNCLEDAIFK